jgi:nucleotide-binding universal stress UspA family protein
MLSQPSILVASDLSKSSDKALEAAENLRKKSKGKIHVIHVTPYPEQWDWLTNDVVMNYYPENFREQLINGLNNQLSAQLERCGVEGTSEILMGPTVQTIIKFTSEARADLLILGHKEKGGVLRLSGVAAKIMSSATIPVLIANKDFDVERVAGLIDPYRPEKKLFSVTEEFGYLCSGDVEFISVFPDDVNVVESSTHSYSVVRLTEEKKKEVKNKFEKALKENADPRAEAKFRVETTNEGSAKKLVKILTEDRIDLAIMTKHQKGKIEKFFLGSVTKGVFDQWKGNLLILPT